MARASNRPEAFDGALKKITYGFYILTTRKSADEMPTRNEDYFAAGTVSWVSQVSFNPPMIMVAVQRQNDLNETIQKSRFFALNFVSNANAPMIHDFAKPTEVREGRLNGYVFQEGITGAPILTAAPGYIECKVTDVIKNEGDHVLIIAEVADAHLKDENARIVTDQDVDYNYGGTGE
jgi:flavin reductase (DIM6/NTAB) family NADH-FMN oxidoreductase RutF